MPNVPDPGEEEQTPEGRKCELCGELLGHTSIDAGFPVVIDPRAPFVQKVLDDHQLSFLKENGYPIIINPDGPKILLMRWGDGTGVPPAGHDQIILGPDDDGVLHIRSFDQRGVQVADTDETKLPPARAQAMKALKERLKDLLPPPVLTGSDLRLMSSVNGVSGIPTHGKSLIVVAAVDSVLHFRIFDGDGKMVVDTDETKLTEATDEKRRKEKAWQIEELRKHLQSLWPRQALTRGEIGRVITAVTSIVGHTLLTYAEKVQIRREVISILVRTPPDDLDLSKLVEDPVLQRLEVAHCPRCLEAMGPGEMMWLFIWLGLTPRDRMDTELSPREIAQALTGRFGVVEVAGGATRDAWRELSSLACELFGHKEFGAETWRQLRELLLDEKNRDFNKFFTLNLEDIIFILQRELTSRAPGEGQTVGNDGGAWVAASKAEAIAKALGYRITLPTILRHADDGKFAIRDAPKGSKHRREVELSSFLRYLEPTPPRSLE